MSSVKLPNKKIELGGGIFAGCASLTEISLPDSIKVIPNEFLAGTGLTSITIPESVTTIMDGAFEGSKLKDLHLPANVKYISSLAFSCKSLKTITCDAVLPPQCRVWAFNKVDKAISVYVPSESVREYMAATGWEDFTNLQSK